ncbi:hypothetical protein WR164_05530 [Philodulcilactobacillus myokoensis]|uniref:Uncharacterized protein n=1 Tax=Philodulcilactobacillus myokoensis TaxID=2929573 RepID=A0A9W6B1U2_9LACO|nr:DUF6681 family protein [Philodulcilactobacillus myokoensis]GLB46574.1 hypothetical protein WR164_05530 [Philodulcilactobacillus myokoensis]
MFSFLDFINRILNYIDIDTKIKSRIYIIVGFLANIYLFYVSFKFIHNGFMTRGIVFFLVALFLLYFVYLNYFYYFTEKQAPFDLSSKIMHKLGIKPREPKNTSLRGRQSGIQNVRGAISNGYFKENRMMPAILSSNPSEVERINQVADDLINDHLMTANYFGSSDVRINRALKENGDKPIYAIGKGCYVPYFLLKFESGKYNVYIGINQANRLLVGHLTQIGMQKINQIDHNRVDIFLASVLLVGGPFKTEGRLNPVEHHQNYQLKLKIAFN